jgi:glycogen operon protein
MSRDKSGAPMIDPPLLDSIANDAVLGKSMLIAEAWDAGGLYQIGSFRYWGKWAEWNGKYRDCLRNFIKGGAEHAPELFCRIQGSNDIYGNNNSESSINFVTCHDGFTLYDLVSYNDKHNEANGENNMDGCNDNNSWNCGAEGETTDPQILDLRMRQMKNMLTILLTSRGIPMLLSGDEFANTQFGNNNAYCLDNEISWLDWSYLEKNKDLFEYVEKLISFRKKHPILHSNALDSGYNNTGYPEFSLHGTCPWQLDSGAPSLSFAYMYAEDSQKYGTKHDAFIYVAVNAFWEGQTFQLPIIPEGYSWKVVLKSSDYGYDGNNSITLSSRSTAILIAQIR